MHRIRQWVLALEVLLGLVGLATVTAQAQTIDYAALKYGTKQTSMASGYFVHPATIRVVNHAYVVTMDLKTAKKLTSWPVTVLSVDGHAPENVRKVKDSAGNSHVYYSFTTTNLKRHINAKLAIDVPDVYKAKHKITFRFKTDQLPALSAATTRTTTAKTTTQQAQKPATSRAASSAKANSQAASAADSAAAKSSTPSSSVSAQSRSSSSTVSSHREAAQAKPATTSAKDADQVPQQRTHWGRLVGGIVAILVLVGGGSWWYFGRH